MTKALYRHSSSFTHILQSRQIRQSGRDAATDSVLANKMAGIQFEVEDILKKKNKKIKTQILLSHKPSQDAVVTRNLKKKKKNLMIII